MRTGPDRHIDFKMFFIAGKCCIQGLSPYNMAQYFRIYNDNYHFLPDPLVGFSYPPAALLYCIPLGFLSMGAALRVFDGLNLLACLALFGSSYYWWKGRKGNKALPVAAWAWLAFSLTLFPVIGTIFTSQTGLFAVAGAMLAIVACRFDRPFVIVAGIVMASSKPQLTAPVLLFLFLFQKKNRRAINAALALVALSGILMVIGNPAPLDSAVLTFRQYTRASVNYETNMYGLAALLRYWGAGQVLTHIVTAAVFFLIFTFVVYALRRRLSADPFFDISASPAAIAVLFTLAGVITAIHWYDLVAFSPAVMLAGTRSRGQQLLLSPALLGIWRPGFWRYRLAAFMFSRFHARELDHLWMSGLMLYVLFFYTLFLYRDQKNENSI